MSRPIVLLVDDDRLTRTVLKQILKDEPYRCVFAEDSVKALATMAQGPAAVIVTDLEMPGMNGIALLGEIRKGYPDTVRLALSAHADAGYLLNAINAGQVYRYILKPWNNLELKITIRQALEFFHMQQEKKGLLAKLEENNRMLEQRVAERTRQLLAVEKQAEIGKHAAYIVHNLSNPLQALRYGQELARLILSDARPDLDGLAKQLDTIQNGLADMDQIVTGILDHMRDERLFATEPIDINEIVVRELEFFKMDPIFKKEVRKEIDLDPDLEPISGNRFQIKQIVDNLIKNAIDAMEATDEKCLRISTRKEGEAVAMVVADTGEGIREKDRNRIFMPDFTTKPAGKGTGLGLASVKSMVDAYGGEITVSSRPGSGTAFEVRIPAAGSTR